MAQAACLGRTDLDWFDTECGHQQAVQVCYTCPVIEPCLNYAIRNEVEDGIWGGLWGGTLRKLNQGRVRGVRRG
jgi:hypothetical protein